MTAHIYKIEITFQAYQEIDGLYGLAAEKAFDRYCDETETPSCVREFVRHTIQLMYCEVTQYEKTAVFQVVIHH